MSFIVTALDEEGVVAQRCGSARSAYDQARELEGAELESVVIIDGGRQYRPDEFNRLVLAAEKFEDDAAPLVT